MAECRSLEEVRENIDRIDREIVRLIAERSVYVKEAAVFKKTTTDVKAPARVEEVISKVRGLAVEHNLEPDIAEKVYRILINCFIDFELKIHEKNQYL